MDTFFVLDDDNDINDIDDDAQGTKGFNSGISAARGVLV